MGSDQQREMGPEDSFCPECGVDESGFFCRNCGTLLRGEDMVLCPRCRQIVPQGEFCNQCGQSLGSIALDLHQLAIAGNDFWVSAADAFEESSELSEGMELAPVEEDESVILAEAELPDWLKELPADSAPAEVKAHIYPSLRPIEEERPVKKGRFLVPVVLLLALLLLGLVFAAVFLLARGALW